MHIKQPLDTIEHLHSYEPRSFRTFSQKWICSRSGVGCSRLSSQRKTSRDRVVFIGTCKSNFWPAFLLGSQYFDRRCHFIDSILEFSSSAAPLHQPSFGAPGIRRPLHLQPEPSRVDGCLLGFEESRHPVD